VSTAVLKKCTATGIAGGCALFVSGYSVTTWYHLNTNSNDMNNKIKKELENESAVLQCAEQFGLVGDPTRMKICWLLCKHKELSVGDIAEILGVSVSVVSHSLKKLKQNHMVETRQEYKHVFYSLADTDFTDVIKNSLKQV
tara:strand:+ start:3251 stop:3673 length:423 start_codon:yes stop_codon:yes gene_type:complete